MAAPTTSLPEWIGGVRNWDYRFCWLRDATLTLLAMLQAGYNEEAVAWRKWLLRAVAGDPADVQIMYGLAGERRLEERELDWLPGYEGSVPVRTGNAASAQLQLDVYGEVMDALYQTRVHGAPPDDSVWSLQRSLLGWLEDGWRLEDSGVWEVRGPTRHFTHSKVMAWVAFDRGVRICEEFGRDGPVERWRAIRDEIHAEVLARGWNEARGAFVQYYGADELDASALVIPLVGFLPHDDPRVVSTVEAIRRDLTLRRARAPVPNRRGRRRRRAPRRRGGLPRLLVLARGGARAAGEPRGGAGAVRAAPRAAERRGPALGGVGAADGAARRELPTGVHPPRARRGGPRALRARDAGGRLTVGHGPTGPCGG